jgi:hypothetical protein
MATFNQRHSIDDPEVASKAGIPVGTSGDALGWVRQKLTQEGDPSCPAPTRAAEERRF